jgi:hypothetical protein
MCLDVGRLNDFLACAPEETKANYDRFLTSSTGLRRVELFSTQHGSMDMHMQSFCCPLIWFVYAIVKNPHIEELACHCDVGSYTLKSLMAFSLQVLEIDLDLVLCFGSRSSAVVVTAFGRNKTITRLKLHVQDKIDLLESILTNLREESSCVNSLVLCSALQVDPSFMGAVQSLLNSSRYLKMFGMEYISLSEEAMYLLLDGLRHSSVDRLSLENCGIQRDAANAFIAYMQTPVASFTENEVIANSLQELFMASDQCTVACKAIESVAAAMLQNLGTDTIGSRLRSLSLKSCCGLPGFYDSVADSDVRLDLERLELGTLCCIDCVGLSKATPTILERAGH